LKVLELVGVAHSHVLIGGGRISSIAIKLIEYLIGLLSHLPYLKIGIHISSLSLIHIHVLIDEVRVVAIDTIHVVIGVHSHIIIISSGVVGVIRLGVIWVIIDSIIIKGVLRRSAGYIEHDFKRIK
jgi:hypothetical protein